MCAVWSVPAGSLHLAAVPVRSGGVGPPICSWTRSRCRSVEGRPMLYQVIEVTDVVPKG